MIECSICGTLYGKNCRHMDQVDQMRKKYLVMAGSTKIATFTTREYAQNVINMIPEDQRTGYVIIEVDDPTAR